MKKENEVNQFIRKHINKVDKNAMSIEKISKFVRLNKHLNLRVNVIFLEDGYCFPIYRGTNVKAKNVVNLLLYKTMRKMSVFHHFAFLPDLSKFARKMYKNEEGKISYEKIFICENCFAKFAYQHKMYEHQVKCFKNIPEAFALFEKGSKIQFVNYFNKFPKEFVGFLDFESSHNKQDRKCDSCSSDAICAHRTTIEAIQLPIAYSLLIIDGDKDIFFKRTYAGEDCIDDLIDTYVKISLKLQSINENPKPMKLTYQEKIDYFNSNMCHICEKEFSLDDGENIKVRDHCHYRGHYMGSAHMKCNFRRSIQKEIPVYCHNFSGYDSHLILKAIKNDERIWKISAIPYNTEKVRTLTINYIQMLDSLNFLQGSLSALVNDLAKSGSSFPILRKSGLFNTESQFKLLTAKSFFCYEKLDNLENLKSMKCIPSQESFYNTLTDSHISDEDYAHAVLVFRELKCKDMYEYMLLYCNLDTFLLADVFSQFRDVMQSKFGLDACNSLSLPSFSFDCMLKYTNVQIDHITDEDVFHMLRQNIRGGFSFISSRIETDIDFTSGKKVNCIDYLDANNLYGHAQSRSLPISDYRFLSKSEIKLIDISNLSEDDETGYIYEVDLEYPSHLHDSHRSYPLAPEKMTVTPDMLSPYQLRCQNELNISTGKVPKLMSTFRKRVKYVTHGQNLKLYISLGMKLTKIHRVLAFTQSKFLKKYIDFCTEMRASALTSFAKNLFKLMANSVYGKFIEDKSKHMQLIFCSTAEYLRKWVMSPRYSNFKIINNDFVAVFLKKPVTAVTQAYAIGFSILELSKEFMYRSYYQYIKPKLGPECRVLMSDTDSLFLASKYKKNNLLPLKSILDTSNFDREHPMFTEKHKSQLGFFKSETGSEKISRFIGLRSKCYAFELKNSSYHTKCKGIKKSFRKKIPVSSFVRCLEQICSYDTTQYTLGSKNHQIRLAKQQKLCFSSFDDKTFLLSCGVHSVPYYSARILANSDACEICYK